ncbi:MmgE/PrpD family protein [Xanthobacter oligotrophicus]|uniref:MmgE/PrpD family protein n=1 Tax=Xanthobacter oligotrophicus TaxID=2607286 RepID=UPI00165EA922|nr:MmgE/PrpD family protein [Xanthobacter oligotrophicus]MCG5236285.1 MmgE/PrpD family protein [Xanthobacter oligotrophicus]
MDAIRHFSGHVLAVRLADIPAPVIEAAKTFLLDSVGVGIAGSAGQWAQELAGCAAGWGSGEEARVFGRRGRFPAAVAALMNAYQIHNSEFDCLHEQAVVHAMTGVLPAALAVADRLGGICGARLLEAVVAGVDVACAIGLGGTRPMKFFRPGVAGGFGATAAAGKLLGFDADTLENAFGTTFAQLCGSMQAHEEGTMLLALQIGFNARNAIQACDLASAGLKAPREVLEGRFGYYALFEDGVDLGPVVEAFGKAWRMAEVAQKPFPSGRATHGALEAIAGLRARHAFSADTVDAVRIRMTPVARSLVGRPLRDDMASNYARLCMAYCAARMLRGGSLAMADFTPEALRDLETHRLAGLVSLEVFDTTSTDAFAPAAVEITLKNGM